MVCLYSWSFIFGISVFMVSLFLMCVFTWSVCSWFVFVLGLFSCSTGFCDLVCCLFYCHSVLVCSILVIQFSWYVCFLGLSVFLIFLFFWCICFIVCLFTGYNFVLVFFSIFIIVIFCHLSLLCLKMAPEGLKLANEHLAIKKEFDFRFWKAFYHINLNYPSWT